MIFEILDGKNELGKSEVPLTSITNQEEYDLDLEITSEVNSSQVLLVLKTKVTFIWNFYEKYKEEKNLYDKKASKNEEMYQKTEIVLSNLNKPFNLLNTVIERNDGGYATSENIIKFKGNPQQYALADKMEDQLKQTLNMKTIKWLTLTKLLLYASIVLSFFNMFVRADFVNMLIPVYILAMFSTSFSSKLGDNLKVFLFASLFTMITDVLWLVFRDSTNASDAGGEDSIRRFVYFTSLISFVIKVVLCLSLWIQVLKTERGKSDGME